MYDDDKEDDGDGNMNEKPSSRSIVDVEYVARANARVHHAYLNEIYQRAREPRLVREPRTVAVRIGGAFEGEEYSSSEEEEKKKSDEDYDEEDYDEDFYDDIEEEELAAAASGEFDFI